MCKILVIDDDRNIRLSIRTVLEALGHEVLEASDGVVGLETMGNNSSVDIAIVDLIMPKKEGLETIRELKAGFPSLGIVAISGGGTMIKKNFLPTAEEFGANAVLEKPFGGDELLAALDKVRCARSA